MPRAVRIPTAIAISNPVPLFLILAGARLTVILVGGNSTLIFLRATLTLSLASLISLPTIPTISNPGSPDDISISTDTIKPPIPSTQEELITANI